MVGAWLQQHRFAGIAHASDVCANPRSAECQQGGNAAALAAMGMDPNWPRILGDYIRRWSAETDNAKPLQPPDGAGISPPPAPAPSFTIPATSFTIPATSFTIPATIPLGRAVMILLATGSVLVIAVMNTIGNMFPPG